MSREKGRAGIGVLVRLSRNLLVVMLLVLLSVSGVVAVDDQYTARRQRMVGLIEDDVRQTSARLGKARLDRRVLDALRTVPRHEFVRRHLRPLAYNNRPLPIGYGQTISQPYIVAVMTDLLNVDQDDVVLEVGTGSGYQAAVLAALGTRVYSIEIIQELAAEASQRLLRLGYKNVQTRVGDGYYGWEEHAPFDAIVVTAAAGSIPPPLLQQLKPGGRMVIPVGSPFLTQQLMLVQKDENGRIKTRQVLPVAFVPLTGKH
jgi:protein-L-isoaspartate(D-aspartate) O-methyltransferase